MFYFYLSLRIDDLDSLDSKTAQDKLSRHVILKESKGERHNDKVGYSFAKFR